ncbi:oligoendopeptidase F [Pseudobutyrivibrio xylanivorans]|uniref:Oligopeptidase F n=1 Tax=Pseudobutyrivibrio xylanivorans DSM 14809 TaxID=1123012 RepID=A0A1M6GJ53_PSEXY|nr:oligoendopeptidase F [Pseudobutyrivibrio xylanivorans]SHJ09951.1 oligoendopeptidase F [Pseudobutyrivibrio xylanivorans DSM 14809]
MAKELVSRDQVRVEDTWDLSAMYESKDAWEADIKFIEEKLAEISKYQGKVCESAENLLSVLETSAITEEKFELAFNYAERIFDQDQGNTEHQSMSQRMFALYAKISAATAFVSPEILACDAAVIDGFIASKPELELYRLQIKEIQRLKAHTLSAEMEKVVAMTQEMANTPSEVYSAFKNVDMTFPAIKDENGEEVVLTDGRFVPMLMSADRRVREDAFKAYYGVYEKYLNTMASIYNGEVKQHIFNSRVRNYSSNLEAAVDANNVSPQVYDNLVKTVNANLDKLHAYVSLRKKCLGVDELHMYDIYTSMIPDAAKTVKYEEAQKTICEALAVLGDDYVDLLKEGFANRWIDVYENKGKRGGAYSATAYGVHPYMLLNYTDTFDDMFTTAHEMGHSMHSYYSNQAQPYIYSGYKIFVAEVASTCNEILLLEYLLKNCTDKKEKAYLLNHYLDSFKGTVFRQTQFAEFEKTTNEMVEAGENLNSENLCKLYKEINEKYYGPDMISDDEIAYEWARIPHFYYNFYVYQYATSFCAAVAIADMILKEGAPAVERYKKFLSSGCTDAPVELLKIAGVDLTTPAPIEAALAKMGEIIKELEKII